MNPDDRDDEAYTQAPERPSKSERKRQVEHLQKVGEALIKLPAGQLEAMPLPDELRHAVLQARKLLNKHAAFKRQRQFIGRIMREIDAGPIIQALDELQDAQHAASAHFHEIEHWRDALLGPQGADALTELIAAHPGLDVQALRQMVGKAGRELRSGKGKRAQRELFAMLRRMLD